MNKLKVFVFLLTFTLLNSCSKREKKGTEFNMEKSIVSLPFTTMELKDLKEFKAVSDNWKIVESVYVDRLKSKKIEFRHGSGILVNVPEKDRQANLFTLFEHGDIELEVDVMMPVNSNSGIYFQGRYEVQLFDSWGKDSVVHGDMGGIYQRWDKTRKKGEEGYEGHSPKINAAKAPGLWQHFKIIFHAPGFDDSGNKIKNAEFEEVWLNGMLIHKNIELSGPTRAAAFKDEKPLGLLMIQGDHGPVALKNLKYKLYDDKEVVLSNMTMREYENGTVLLPVLDSLTPIREVQTDTISAAMASGEKTQRILDFQGNLVIPESGEYLFDFRLDHAGGLLIVENDTILNMDGNFIIDSLGISKVPLSKGEVPFRLIFNKHNPWRRGFALYLEGLAMQKKPLHAPSSINLLQGIPDKKIMVDVADEVVTQRSFLMHKGNKRTHCISVGTPQKINYAYDLAIGSLLKAWNGPFLDATQMWHARGLRQLGEPSGFTIAFHGDTEFSNLENQGTNWPKTVLEDSDFKFLGYELDENEIPTFLYQIHETKVSSKLVPSSSGRSLKRKIKVEGSQGIWHKIGEGSSISELPDGTFIINEESYFVDFKNTDNLKPIIRRIDGVDELLVKIPAGKQEIAYNIIW